MFENAPLTLPDDLATVVKRLAARAALLTISEREHPAVVERLSEYMQDRGAVGLLLRDYDEGHNIESVAYSFWQSRTERVASRFEDLITTVLVGICTSFIAGILVEMWKGEFGPLKRLLSDDEREALRFQARKEPRLLSDMRTILPCYYAKTHGGGVAHLEVARNLYLFLAEGGSFLEFLEHSPDAVTNMPKDDLLKYLKEFCLGVVKTEMARPDFDLGQRDLLERRGLPLSPYLAFGEVISLYNAEDLGMGPSWEQVIWSKIRARRLYPDHWPIGVRISETSPKVLILDDEILSRVDRDMHAPDVIAASSGVISATSGMTSHLAVLSRNIGIGAIGCNLSETEKAESKFALFQEGRLRLYREVPNLTAGQFEELIGAVRR